MIKIPDEIIDNIKNLKTKGFDGTFDNKRHHGASPLLLNNYWYEFSFSKPVRNYNSIIMPCYCIDKPILDEAKKCVYTDRYKAIIDGEEQKVVSMANNDVAHIDGNSGNIHPEYKEKKGYDKIRQLVLCSEKKGPNTQSLKLSKETYKYSDKTIVHKACYFPLIEDDESLKDNWRYKLLKKFAINLRDELERKEVGLSKKVLGEKILREISK